MSSILNSIKNWILGLLSNFWATKKTYIIIAGVVILAVALLGLLVPATRPYISWLGIVAMWILNALKAIAGVIFYVLSLPSKMF